MKSRILLCLIFTCVRLTLHSQSFNQYFDGADTAGSFSYLEVVIDTADSTNIWQVGPPQKAIFDSAASQPNVLVTDTVDFYPSNDTSSFTIQFDPNYFSWGILAFQWKQMLDMDDRADGGIIEFSFDAGAIWQNAFDNPYVYNFYGYDTLNVDTLPNGELGFTGKDSIWKDIWLCYDAYFLNFQDSLQVRFTFLSDSIDNNREGWMIDNILAHVTIIHTVAEKEQQEYLKVFPTITNGNVNIQAKKLNEEHIIEEIQLINVEGKVVKSYGISPTKFRINISDQAPGNYFLQVKTNKRTETVKLVLTN